MIAEVGLEQFNIRELARRADVAQKTLYNAFGNKDGIISSAILQFVEELISASRDDEEHPSLQETLRYMIFINHRLLSIRSYLVVLVNINNSPNMDADVREIVHGLGRTPNLALGKVLEAAGELAPTITPDRFAERLTSFIFAAHTDWCVGYVADSEMIAWTCESYLIGYAGLTCGDAKKEAEDWLHAIRTNSPQWTQLSSSAATPVKQNRRRGRPAKDAD